MVRQIGSRIFHSNLKTQKTKMKKFIAIAAVATLTACNSGTTETTTATTTDTTTVTVDTAVVKADTTVVADSTTAVK